MQYLLRCSCEEALHVNPSHQEKTKKEKKRKEEKKVLDQRIGRKQKEKIPNLRVGESKKRKENSRSKIGRKQKKYTERSLDQTSSEQIQSYHQVSTKSGSDIFDSIEINVASGAGKNVLPSART